MYLRYSANWYNALNHKANGNPNDGEAIEEKKNIEQIFQDAKNNNEKVGPYLQHTRSTPGDSWKRY